MSKRILLASALLISGVSATAHEGHGAVSGVLHYLAEPVHLLPGALVVAAIALIARRVRQQR